MPLKLIKRAGSPYWQMHGTLRGVPVRESTGVADRAKAEEIRIIREAEILDRSIHGAKATATWIEASVFYMEQGGDGTFLPPLDQKLGTTRLNKIDTALLVKLRRELYPHLK